jgi:glycosyltransferase involved in cell wall biosynthesis
MTGGNIVADREIVVTALIVTYNHVHFIEEALDSALAQATTFPVEILVSEDASTDGTRDIVRSYALAHPDRIRAIYSHANLRSNEVVARGIKAARGRYIALLDGDDCWIAPDKLQRQADFLDRNPDYAAHFFNAEIVGGGHLAGKPWTRPDHPARVDIAGIWEGNPFATSGGMMRRSALERVGPWYYGFFPRTDWPLYILCAMSGELRFEPEIAACYRLHDDGLYSALSEQRKLESTRTFYRDMGACFGGRFRAEARAGQARLFHDWGKDFLRRKELRLAWRCWMDSLLSGGVGRSVRLRESVRLALRLAKASVLAHGSR